MKEMITTLNKTPIGSNCLIYDIDSSLPIKGRLKELGFSKDSVVDKLQVGFFGSPIACRVCGAVIAIRAEDADKIYVKDYYQKI